MPVIFQKLMCQACVIEITSSQVVMEQQKDRHGVCIIPEKQDQTVRQLIERIGRQVTEILGSKRGTLRYMFSPSLTEEEYNRIQEEAI